MHFTHWVIFLASETSAASITSTASTTSVASTASTTSVASMTSTASFHQKSYTFRPALNTRGGGGQKLGAIFPLGPRALFRKENTSRKRLSNSKCSPHPPPDFWTFRRLWFSLGWKYIQFLKNWPTTPTFWVKVQTRAKLIFSPPHSTFQMQRI